MTGFNVEFVKQDHHFGNLFVEIRDPKVETKQGNIREIKVVADFGLRDTSGMRDGKYLFDDTYQGTITGVLMYQLKD